MSIVVPLLLLILSNSCNIALVSSLNGEGLALFSFKNSIKEDPENSLSNWNYSDENPCSWNGITCNEQKVVVSITIPKRKLVGSLSFTLGSLSELRHVNLRNNNLSGMLPPELCKPQGLQSLVLYGNLFTGPLPVEVGNLGYLQTLDLSQNLFNGSLPISLVHCRRLRNLDLSYNGFSGSLPDKFGENLGLLEKLDLSYNYIGGSIPSDLGSLSNLQGTLDFSHNSFNGSIPASLGNLPEKVYIDLTYNELTGPIPQNGALVNRGPTAFIGNPNLCGPPLKDPCFSSGNEASPPSSFPYIPSNYPTQGAPNVRGGRGLSKTGLIAIIIGDVIGIVFIGFLFSYCYLRVFPNFCKRKDIKGDIYWKGKKKNECLCFRKDESETLSEKNSEHHDLVALDGEVGFNLDELLKASAFVLGKSGAGIVYKVVLEDGVTLAVRRLGEGGSQRYKEFKIEVEAVGKIRHPNVVTLRAYYWSVDEKLLIYDFVPNGNLVTAIHGKPGLVEFTPLSWSARLKIMKGVAKGLLYLHDCSPKKYVHGDLKPSNILLGQDVEPKISDFGLGRLANITGGSPTVQSSRWDPDTPQEVATFASTSASHYQAPESLKVVKPSQKWDVYSYGVVLLEMITGKSPLVQSGGSDIDLVRWMQLCIEEKRPVYDVLDTNLVGDADREEEMIGVLKIAMACTQVSPEKRPSMRSVTDALERLSVSS